jgi:hypothetical protein
MKKLTLSAVVALAVFKAKAFTLTGLIVGLVIVGAAAYVVVREIRRPRPVRQLPPEEGRLRATTIPYVFLDGAGRLVSLAADNEMGYTISIFESDTPRTGTNMSNWREVTNFWHATAEDYRWEFPHTTNRAAVFRFSAPHN